MALTDHGQNDVEAVACGAELMLPGAKPRARLRRLRLAGVVVVTAAIAVIAIEASGSGGGSPATSTGNPSGGPVLVSGTPDSLSLGPNGGLYFIDNGRIEVLARNHVHVVLSSLSGSAKSDSSIAGLSGLSATKSLIWFAASGKLYRASLSGHAVRSVPAAPGVARLDATDAGTVVYTTSWAVYEHLADGSNIRIEGGGRVYPDVQRSGMSATSLIVQPTDAALGPGGGVYVVDLDRGESLDLVKAGTFYPVTSSGGSFHLGLIVPGPNGVLFGFDGWDFAEINGLTVKVLFPWPHVEGYFVTPDSIAASSPNTVYVGFSNYASSPGASSGIVRFTLPTTPSAKLTTKVVVTTK